MISSIDVSIITVGMNHRPFIEKLFHSLFVRYKPIVSFEVIYVDNCSADGSVEFIQKNYPDIIIIRNQRIAGFGHNNNTGAKRAKGKYIAIINPDIQLLERSIDKLFSFYEKNTHTGIVVPKLLNPDLSLQYSVRNFITIRFLFARILTRGNDNSDKKNINNYLCKDINPDQTQYINWSIGAALFMSREFYNRLNGFDEDYFLYMEDEDICLRSWKDNRPVIYFPEACMIHNHLRGSKNISKKAMMHFRSLFIFFKKHGLMIPDFRQSTEGIKKAKDKPSDKLPT